MLIVGLPPGQQEGVWPCNARFNYEDRALLIYSYEFVYKESTVEILYTFFDYIGGVYAIASSIMA